MKIGGYYSPNFSVAKRSKNLIKMIIIHYTGMQSERESIIRLCSSKSEVSSHFIINEKGQAYRLVEDNKIAWHAGKSCWGKYRNLNKNSIGIELVNKGHRFGYTNFKKKQILTLKELCKKLIKKYNISKNNIVGHSDIAPLRKIDPGEKFPWEKLAKNNIGIWHNCNSLILKKFRRNKILKENEKIKFKKNLRNIGYCLSNNDKFLFVKIVKAFQRHYRKELINGVLDRECLIIAENISKKL